MDDSDPDSDPRRPIPTVLWLMLGLGLVVLFSTAVALLGGHITPSSVGPPAGSP